MAEFTLKIRRYNPETGEAPYWDEHTVDLGGLDMFVDGTLRLTASGRPQLARRD